MTTEDADKQEIGSLVTRLNERVKSFKHTFIFETTTAEEHITAAIVENDIARLRAYDRLLTKTCTIPTIDFVMNFLHQRGHSDDSVKDSDEATQFVSFYTAVRENSRRYEPKSTRFEDTVELFFTAPELREAIGGLVTERKLYRLEDIRETLLSIDSHHTSLGTGVL